MSELTHQYETTIDWTGGREAKLMAGPRASILVGAPPEFGGTAQVWSPEHLCVAAVSTCVMLTFVTIAANSKVSVRAYTASATGTLEKVEGRGMEITHVVVKPRVTIGPDVDPERLERLLKMAEKNCFISNSLKATVTLEPEIVRLEE